MSRHHLIEDDLLLEVRGPKGRLVRHWRISQPRASVAVSLRSKILAACGEGLSQIVARILVHDQDVIAGAEEIDPASEDATSDALRLLRNAQAGRAIRGMASEPGSPVEVIQEGDKVIKRPTAGMVAAAAAIERVLMHGLKEGGIRLRSDLLFGEVDAEMGEATISKPGLLWQLAYASNLRFCGGSDKAASGDEIEAARSDGILSWINALDEFLYSPAEMEILFAWCVVHTFRPF